MKAFNPYSPPIQNPKSKIQNVKMFRIIGFILGLMVAAAGGVIAYRALFLEPSAAIVVTNEDIREVPNTLRVTGGIVMLIVGMALAFYAARRKPL